MEFGKRSVTSAVLITATFYIVAHTSQSAHLNERLEPNCGDQLHHLHCDKAREQLQVHNVGRLGVELTVALERIVV